MDQDRVVDVFERLLAMFDVDTGYPTIMIETPEGPMWGPVSDELNLLLSEITEIMEEAT